MWKLFSGHYTSLWSCASLQSKEGKQITLNTYISSYINFHENVH